MAFKIFLKSLKVRFKTKVTIVSLATAGTIGIVINTLGIGLSADAPASAAIVALLGVCVGTLGGALTQMIDNDYIILKQEIENLKKDSQKNFILTKQKTLLKNFCNPINDLREEINIVLQKAEEYKIAFSEDKNILIKSINQSISNLYTEYLANRDDAGELKNLLIPQLKYVQKSISDLKEFVTLKIKELTIQSVILTIKNDTRNNTLEENRNLQMPLLSINSRSSYQNLQPLLHQDTYQAVSLNNNQTIPPEVPTIFREYSI